MNDIFSPLFEVEQACEVYDPCEEEFVEARNDFLLAYGERGIAASYLVLWLRVGLPQRIESFGFDAHSAMLYADSLVSGLIYRGYGMGLSDLANCFPELGRNHAVAALSVDALDSLIKGCELLANVIEENMGDSYLSGEEVFEISKKFDQAVAALGNCIADSAPQRVYGLVDYYIRATCYLEEHKEKS